MEYTCKITKKDKPTSFFLSDVAIRIRRDDKEDVVHYSGIASVWINKSNTIYSMVIQTIDGHQYSLNNQFIHDDGRKEDTSNAYALFARVLHMHLREKSRATFTYVKRYNLPEWQKFLWVPIAFAIAYWLNFLGYTLFHWTLQGVALAAIGLLLIVVSERNRAVEKSTSGDIPMDFLPG